MSYLKHMINIDKFISISIDFHNFIYKLKRINSCFDLVYLNYRFSTYYNASLERVKVNGIWIFCYVIIIIDIKLDTILNEIQQVISKFWIIRTLYYFHFIYFNGSAILRNVFQITINKLKQKYFVQLEADGL